ncbi:MAG: DnaA N-terminal domain-containing protein [Pseudomonadota bacterium]
MQLPRPVGREAALRKYDILSALMAFALSKDKHVQRQVLRVMALITTRYNWQRDELTMGQGVSNVVPLRAVPTPAADGSVWATAQAMLLDEDAATYGTWFHALTDAGVEANCLTLAAPTRFHATYVSTNLKERLLAALRRADPSFRDVRVVA